MQSGGFTETIWHFIGSLQMYDSVARSSPVFQGEHSFLPPIDDDNPGRDPRRGLDFDELVSLPTVFHPTGGPNDPELAQNILRPTVYDVPILPLPPFRMPSVPLIPISDGGGRISTEIITRRIQVEYREGPQQTLLHVTQVNLAEDRDVVTSDALRYPDGQLVMLPEISLGPEMARAMMRADAVATDGIPNMSDMLRAGAEDVVAMVSGRDAAWAQTGIAPTGRLADTAPQGRVIDGVPSEESPELPTPREIAPWRTEKTADTASAQDVTMGPPSAEETAVIAELGLNQQINIAVIVDVNEATGSMIIEGDYFYSRGIVQANILVDDDHVDVAFAEGLSPLVQSKNNEAYNIADFVVHESTLTAKGAFVTWKWTVDVVRGDFYDVKSITQFNGLDDNDRVVQADSGFYIDLKTGENQQINWTKVLGIEQYDIIVIGGDYHRSDWIYQYNIIVDPDYVALYAGHGGDDATVTTGFNQLVNDARIETYDPAAFKPIQEGHRELVDLIDAGATVIDPNPDWELYGTGKTLKVLYVSGDYFDVNVITQVNVLADGDQILQARGGGGGSQGVAAGGNSALNKAYIVDPGPLTASNYLGGDFYDESVLIQVEIISDSDTVAIHDTSTLLPELVAFAEHDSALVERGPSQQPSFDLAQHDHMTSTMLA